VREFENNKEKNRLLEETRMALHNKKVIPEENVDEIIEMKKENIEKVKDAEHHEEDKKVDKEEEKIMESRPQKAPLVKFQKRQKEKIPNNKDFQMHKNLIET
jgi:hypothetical protein